MYLPTLELAYTISSLMKSLFHSVPTYLLLLFGTYNTTNYTLYTVCNLMNDFSYVSVVSSVDHH